MSLINDALKRASRNAGQPPSQNTPSIALQPVESLRPRRSLALILVPSLAVILLAGAFALFWVWHRGQTGNTAGQPAVRPVANVSAPAPTPPPPPPSTPQPSIKNEPVPAPAQPRVSQPPSQPAPPVVAGESVEQRNLARLTNKIVTRIVTPPPEKPPAVTTSTTDKQPGTTALPEQPQVIASAPPRPPGTENGTQPPPAQPVPPPPIPQPPVVVPQQAVTPAPTSVATPPAPPVPKPQPVEWPKINLQGIFYGEDPSAMINDRVVGVGEEIGEVKVLSIERRSVKLQFRGETKEWKLNR